MREETPEKPQKLRSGFSTGACATATSLAAANALLTGDLQDRSTIVLPRGKIVEFKLQDMHLLNNRRAYASTVKDAGDDPDETHLATIFTEVELAPKPGVRFHAGSGVGTVTKAGLSLEVGEPAINPVPRKMIREHLENLAREQHYAGGFDVTVGVVDGEKIAEKTMNGRLGIIGGLSILGTTGIVKPYSCSAFIASIHQSIDVASANGVEHVAASTGSTSERYIQHRLGLSDMAMVEMGDFAGAVFKHLRKVPMRKLSLCGGFGKISKLAAGHLSLHSKDSSVDFEFLGKLAISRGASDALVGKIREANTSLEALDFCGETNVPLVDEILARARQQALEVTRGKCSIDIYCVDRGGNCIGEIVGA